MMKNDRLKRMVGRKPPTTPNEDFRHQVKIALIGAIVLAAVFAGMHIGGTP